MVFTIMTTITIEDLLKYPFILPKLNMDFSSITAVGSFYIASESFLQVKFARISYKFM